MKNEAQHAPEMNLLIMNHHGDRRDYTIKSEHGVFIGKSFNCGIQLNDPNVADIHCRLELSSGKLTLQRWLSVDGLKVNQKQVESETTIQPEDVIELGSYVIRVMAACNEPVQTTPSSILQLRPSLSKPLAHRDEATERYSPESPLQRKDQLGHAVSNSDPAKTLTRALDTIQSYVDAATADRCETAPEQSRKPANEDADETSPPKDLAAAQHRQAVCHDSYKSSPSTSGGYRGGQTISDLREEITKLQNQLIKTAKKNDDLQQRLDSRNNHGVTQESKPCETGSKSKEAKTRGQRSDSDLPADANKKNRHVTPEGALQKTSTTPKGEPQATKESSSVTPSGSSSISYTTPRTKSLTCRRLPQSSSPGKTDTSSEDLNPADRIQALRSQLREQYKINNGRSSIFSRLTQLWK